MRSKIIHFLYHKAMLRWLLPLFHRVIGRTKFVNKHKNTVNTTTAHLFKSKIRFLKNQNVLYIGQSTDLHYSTIDVKGKNNTIYIGDNGFINGLTLIIEGDHNTIHIGDDAFILDNTRIYVVDGSTFSMGEGCMFSDRIEIRTTDNHAIFDRATDKRINYEEDVILHDRIWVGTGVTILKGSEIADGCIIGAGSLITRKHNTPNAVIAGNPGKMIKENVRWTMAR